MSTHEIPRQNPLLNVLPRCLVPVVLMFTGCATVPERQAKDPVYLMERACRPARDVKQVKGSLWLKTVSKEASGQFPAEVTVKAPDQLIMEVTNLIGGTEAIIRVDRDQYVIDIPSKKNQKAQDVRGQGSWGGIPLRWATDLFLGKIPCPSESAMKQATRSVTSEGDLVLKLNGQIGELETYVYHFRNWAGEVWPESLHYEVRNSSGPGSAPGFTSVDFKFDDPEDVTLGPRKWEAKSSRGEVKVRWKARDVSR